MKKPYPALAAVLLALLCSTRLAAQPASELSLHDALELAVQRSRHSQDFAGDGYQSSSWLAGLPSLSLSYLGSDERYGTDEAELSVNLPVKSGRRRSADASLLALTGALDSLGERQRQLYFSGLIREAVWSYRQADTRRRFANDKRRVLLDLERRQQELLAASADSEYALLLVQAELVEVDIARQADLQEARRWLQRFGQLTGLASVPADIREAAVDASQFHSDSHPDMRALELAHSQRQQVLLANSAQAADWNVSVTAKNLDTAGYDEQQYGLGVEIPLSAIKLTRQADSSEWRSAERDFLLAREQLDRQLLGHWDALLGEQETLQQKQALLERASGINNRIAAQLEDLRASNEIAQEIVLRRMMGAIDTRAELALNLVRLDQNTAMLRQAAGISL